jgi:hypothetical protein
MPTEQRVGLYEESRQLRPGDQPTEAGKERTIRRLQSRAGYLPAEDGHLVAEHDNLDGQIGVVGPLQEEELDGPDEGEIEKGEGHRPFSRLRLLWRMTQINVLDDILGTHRVCPRKPWPGRARRRSHRNCL